MKAFIVAFVLNTFVHLSHGSLLRGWPMKKVIDDTILKIEANGSFECDVYNLDAMTPPGEPDIDEDQWICVKKSGDEVRTFFFDRNFTERFASQLPEVGIVRMSVPWGAVDGANVDTSYEGITVTENISNRRKLAARMGTQKVLIVRVIGTDQSPTQWKNQIYDDFFGDENNLSSRYRECSKGRLNLIPATGEKVDNGIININIDMKVTAVHYMTVSDKVENKLNNMNLDYKTKIMIMPNGVDFGGGAAWAGLFGDTIWVRSVFSPFPMVQVHEYGHLLGMHHSGKGSKSYADDTGYMGNQLPWNDEGSITCFNPAKMWYLGWFEWRHVVINPSSRSFNDNIVSLDDVVNSNAAKEKMIVKIEGDAKEYFIMFNRAKGMNRGAVGYRDRVVITEQGHESAISYAMAGLSDGEMWTRSNFAGTGRDLIVKNCSRDQNGSKDTAKVLIYLKGLNEQSCDGNSAPSGPYPTKSPTKSPTQNPTFSNGQCKDYPGWVDSANDSCQWYSRNDNCRKFGRSSGKGKYSTVSANEACCACGGGNANIESSPTASPTISPTSSPTVSPTSSVARSKCESDETWYDSGGTKFNCEWYGRNEKNCEYFGHRFEKFGKTANEACCVCQR